MLSNMSNATIAHLLDRRFGKHIPHDILDTFTEALSACPYDRPDKGYSFPEQPRRRRRFPVIYGIHGFQNSLVYMSLPGAISDALFYLMKNNARTWEELRAADGGSWMDIIRQLYPADNAYPDFLRYLMVQYINGKQPDWAEAWADYRELDCWGRDILSHDEFDPLRMEELEAEQHSVTPGYPLIGMDAVLPEKAAQWYVSTSDELLEGDITRVDPAFEEAVAKAFAEEGTPLIKDQALIDAACDMMSSTAGIMEALTRPEYREWLVGGWRGLDEALSFDRDNGPPAPEPDYDEEEEDAEGGV